MQKRISMYYVGLCKRDTVVEGSRVLSQADGGASPMGPGRFKSPVEACLACAACIPVERQGNPHARRGTRKACLYGFTRRLLNSPGYWSTPLCSLAKVVYNSVLRGCERYTDYVYSIHINSYCSKRGIAMTTTTIPRGKYHIWTVGCQMNQADSQRIQAILDDLGWEEAGMDQANLVILNTCSVRRAPEEKAHNQLSQLKQAKSKRSDLLVALMGCMIGNQKTIDELSKRYPHIDLFMKVEQADILPRFLEERWTPISGAGCLDIEYMPPDEVSTVEPIESILPTFATSTSTVGKHTVLPMAITPKPGERTAHYPTKIEPLQTSPTAWLPIILGCNKVCTYCIVPYRRGRERSRPIDELVTEARTLVAKGAKELTLLGQTVEAYGMDLPDKPDLAVLMSHLSEIDALERIRFMTSYPRHMNDGMIERMAALPKVCEHVNIPVQAGDDTTLQRMKRGYTVDEYRHRIERLRALWPDVSLSTDVIVGFSGETEADFQHTR